MMGWTEGTGLGTEGEGRVEPMSVEQLPMLDSSVLTSRADKQTSTLRVRGWVQAKAGKLGSIKMAILDTFR